MQVTFRSQHIFNFPQYNLDNSINAQTDSIDKRELLALSNYEQCAGFLANLQTNFKPEKIHIKKIQKLLKDEKGDFSIQKAAKCIKQITDSQLLLYSDDDINKVVAKVIERNPSVSKSEVFKTLARLTSYSNYDSIDTIEKYCKTENIKEIYQTEKLTVNNVFSYLSGDKKAILKLASDEMNPKVGLFLDRNTIEELSELKTTKPNDFAKLKSDIVEGKTKLILLDGWEALTEVGNQSFNFVGKWGDLVETTSSIIKAQSNNTESVFNKDIIENINKIFEDDMPIDIVRNIPDNINSSVIAKRLNPKTLNEEDIVKWLIASSSFIFAPNNDKIVPHKLRDCLAPLENQSVDINDKNLKKILRAKEQLDGKKISLQEMLSLMFLYTCNVYSPRKIASEMQDMQKKLSDICFYYDKPSSNMLFVVPKKDKSYGLMNYQYSKVNNIPLSDYIYINKDDLKVNEEIGRNKLLILFDDFSGSGHSMMWELLPYSRFRYVNKQPIVFAALTYLPNAKKIIEQEIDTLQSSRFVKDSFVGGKEIKTLDDLANLIAHRKTNLLTRCIDKGYSSGGCTIAFPHVIPDNCIDISGLILANLLKSKTANKAKMNAYKEKLLIDKIN